MAEIRYAKLNCNWDESKWIDPLSDGAKLAWVHLITYVKAYGFGGKAKTKDAALFARHKGMRAESFEEMFAAAKVHGALVEIDGLWTLTGWRKHQGDTTNAERQADFRERHREGNALLNQEGGVGNALPSKSNGDSNARREEKRRESNEELEAGQPSRGEPASGSAEIEALERIAEERARAEDEERRRVREFWYGAAQATDPIVVGLCNAAFRVQKFKFVAPSSLAVVSRVVERIRKKAPNDAAILDEIDRFRDYYAELPKIRGAGQWWSAFENWCGKSYGRWKLARDRGGLMVVDGGAGPTPEQKEAAALEAAIRAGSLRRLPDGRVV